ncbi:MAG: zinc-ribbon domain-containing protein [Actinomycetota bacterium]
MKQEVERERTKPFCPRCGKEAREGVTFCTACGLDLRVGTRDGAAQEGEGDAARPLPGKATEAPEHETPPRARPPEPGALSTSSAAAGAGRKRLALVLGGLGALFLVAGAVLLVIYLALLREGVRDPMDLARRYMKAAQEKDLDALEECFDPEYLSAGDLGVLEEMGLDARGLAAWMMSFVDIRFSGVKLKVEHEDARRALVVTTAGSLSYSIMGWEQELNLGSDPMHFRMVRKGGRWYLDQDPINEIMGKNLGRVEELELFEDPDIRELWEQLMEKMQFGDEWLRDLEDLWREMQERLEEGEEEEGGPAGMTALEDLGGRPGGPTDMGVGTAPTRFLSSPFRVGGARLLAVTPVSAAPPFQEPKHRGCEKGEVRDRSGHGVRLRQTTRRARRGGKRG